MNDTDLNRIIEETFQNIVRNEGPGIFQTFSNFVQDLSHVAHGPGRGEPEQESIMDVSFNRDIYTTPITTTRTGEMLDDFSLRWFQQMNSYHNCMRDYHKNMIQMNRITNNLLINIAAEHPGTTRLPSIEIQGFSIPLPIPAATPPITYPNISQIMAATDVFIYNNDEDSRIPGRCPISLEDFVIGDELCEIRHCHHVFKWIHLQSWFSRHSNCPVCRHDIRDFTRA